MCVYLYKANDYTFANIFIQILKKNGFYYTFDGTFFAVENSQH